MAIDDQLSELGFAKSRRIEGRSSVADIYPAKLNRCGIYVLHFSNGEYYVGQTVDIVRRFAQHSHTHKDIESISFKKVARKHLNIEEENAVRHLETAQLRLRNIQLVSFSYAKTDFELIMSPEDQERWLNDTSFFDLAGNRVIDNLL
jgi:predicted GIY-YIG superfamily endonuclease